MPLGKPSCLGGASVALLDPAVADIALTVFRAGRRERRVGEEQGDIGVKRALVLLERENIVRFLLKDLGGNRLLRTDRIDGHDGAVDRQEVEKLGDRRDLVALGLDRSRRSCPAWCRATSCRRSRQRRKPWRAGSLPMPKTSPPALSGRAPAEPGAASGPAQCRGQMAENGAATQAAPRRTW